MSRRPGSRLGSTGGITPALKSRPQCGHRLDTLNAVLPQEGHSI